MTKPSSTPPRLCPTCGTRVGDLATKCIVCGADLGGQTPAAKAERPRRSLLPQRPSFLQPTKIPPAAPTTSNSASTNSAAPPPTATQSNPPPPESAAPRRGLISIPLPIALGVIGVFIVMSLILFVSALGILPLGGLFGTATATFTPRAFVPPTFTLAPTPTETPAPTPTPLPPITHTVVQGESCISLAVKYNVSVASILDSNGLSQACPIFVGQRLSVPQPTHTPTAPATNTLSPDSLTQNALPRTKHTVAAGDTLLSIAARYGVDVAALARENGITATTPIRVGQVLTVPLYAKAATAGPTPTATALPPYPAPALLSPANGAAISSVEQNVVLQWATVDLLKQGEAYMVTVEDVTCNCAKRKQEVTNTTRYIVNIDLKPAEVNPHVFKWTVVTVRRTGTSAKGDAIYAPAGATSEERTFTWAGVSGAVAPAPTKQP